MQSIRAPFGRLTRRVLAFGTVSAALFLLTMSGVRADDVPPPTLKHGVSLSNWFTDSGREQLRAIGFSC